MKRFVTSALVAITVSAALSSVLAAGPKKVIPVRQRMLSLTNEFRTQNGVAPLRSSAVLNEVAARYVMIMANKDQLGHSLDGKNAGQRINDAGYSATLWAENIAWNSGQKDPYAAAIEAWKNSPRHRANMLKGEFNEMGVAVAYMNGKYYFCMVFGKDLRAPSGGVLAR